MYAFIRFSVRLGRVLALFLLALSAFPPPAVAQGLDYPALYRVVGVASNDVLNVRQGPGASHPILDILAPNATNIEVVGTSPDGRWAMVNTMETTGYASLRYLQRQPGPPASQLPLPLNCGGTEPFWDLSIAADGSAQYRDPETAPVAMSLTWSGPAAARPGYELGARLDAPAGNIHAVLLREQCGDGMSDYTFALSIRAILTRPSGTYMVEGCCALR